VPELNFSVKIFTIFLLFVTFFSVTLEAAPLEEELRRDVVFLCDTLHKGREFGESGSQSAAFYICKSFKDAGLWTKVQSFSYNGKVGHNVIACTPGFYDRYIVVGAYYDGLGKVGGKWSPGADSNVSGTAALLSLARILAHDAQGSTGIAFVAFDAHHADLYGSRSFANVYLKEFPVSMMINIDIIGSSDAPLKGSFRNYVIALGGRNYCWDMDNANRTTGLYICYDYYGSSRFTDLFYRSISDQKWFLEKRIPSVMFTSGITMDTNRLTDVPDKLDYKVFASRVQLMEKWIKMLL